MKKAMLLACVATILAISTGTVWADTREVSKPIQVTSNGFYERGQSIVFDGTDYWLFYGRSATEIGNFQAGNPNPDPDTHDYVVYYKKAASVADLPAATPTLISGASVTMNADSYLGETGSAFFGGQVWAFASIDIGPTADVYGWWFDGTWHQVASMATGLGDGSAHHDEIEFGGEMFMLLRRGNFMTTHTSTSKTGGWSTEKDVGIGADAGGGLAHFFIDGADLYRAVLRSSAPRKNFIFKYDSGTDSWSKIAETASSGWDPTLFKAGSDFVFAQAPFSGDGGGRQWIIQWSGSVLDSTLFAGGSKMVSEGKFGTDTWIEFWPIGFTDNNGDSYLFYTPERKPGSPGPEITGNIWYLKVDWNLANNHHTIIQEGIDAAVGSTVNIAAGTFVENIHIDKPLELAGAGQALTTIIPAFSDPDCMISGGGGTFCSAAAARDVTVILIESSDVTIHDLTVDGDNPALVSGEVHNGADIDARVGIAEDFFVGAFDNLHVHDCTVRNIFLRGIYPSSDGNGFHIHDDILDNIVTSIAIFNWGSTGIVEDCTISRSASGIVANHSKGMIVRRNVITTTGDGIHTDNPGDFGFAPGAFDLIFENTVTGGFAIGVFNPLMLVKVEDNTSLDADEMLWTSLLQAGGAVPEFRRNTVDGGNLAGSIGFNETTDMFGFGFGDVNAIFVGNTILNVDTGILLDEADPATSVTISASENLIEGVIDAVLAAASASADATFSNNSFSSFSSLAIASVGGATVDASGNWYGTTTPAGVGAAVAAGVVDYTPWLDSGTDVGGDPADGFQGDFSTLHVDDDSMQVGATLRIQEGIDLVTASTVIVEAGTYPGNITIAAGVTLESTGGAASTTIAGAGGCAVTIGGDGVTVDGFTITNPTGTNAICSVDHSTIAIRNNIVTNVGGTTVGGNHHAVLIESNTSAVDDVIIEDNEVNNVVGSETASKGSASAITAGFSTGDEDITGLIIRRNTISNVTARIDDFATGGRGAYGILINHGTGITGKTVGVQVLNNTITDLEGLWAHGIGLEGNTPAAVVQGNIIRRLTDHKSPSDAVAIMVEDNASASSVEIHFNTFTDMVVGIQNKVSGTVVNAEDNWWNSSSGPEDIDDGGETTEVDVDGCTLDQATEKNADGTGSKVIDTSTAVVDYCPRLLGAGTMSLEVPAGCQSDTQITVQLWMRDLAKGATGFFTGVTYDTGSLSYRSDLSSYTVSPFLLHITSLDQADDGLLQLDGSEDFEGPGGTNVDALLATLVFDVVLECGPTTLTLTSSEGFPAELSFEGTPLPTNLVDTPSLTLDSTDPVITCPGLVTVECDEPVGPSTTFGATGATTGGISVYYNTTGPADLSNAAYIRTHVSLANSNGAEYFFDTTPLTGVPVVSWESIFSGIAPLTQFGLDMIRPLPTDDGSVAIPTLTGVDNTNGTPGGATAAGTVSWALNDYKPNAPNGPTNATNAPTNSIIRGAVGGDPLIDIEIVQLELVGSTLTFVGKLDSDDIIHWFTPATPDSPMSNFGLNGDFYISGTLTLAASASGVDHYEGTLTIVANAPTATGVATATDNCTFFPAITVSDDTSGLTGCNGTGAIIRTWTATDECGRTATCDQTVTVADTTAPVIDPVASDLTVECDGAGNAADFAAWLASNGGATATDNCGGVTWTNNSAGVSNLCGETGAETVTFTATDDCGNFSTTTATFTIEDTVAPAIGSCPASFDVNADAGGCDAVVTYTAPGATDDCDAAPVVTCVPASGSVFPTGTTVVTCTAVDDCDNSDAGSVCTFDVTVNPLNDVGVDVELVGVSIPVTRCIHFVGTSCGNTADIDLMFVDHDGDDANENGIEDSAEPGGTTLTDPSTPVRAIATIEIGCGDLTDLCAKDEQHTLYDSTTLTLTDTGTTYSADTVLSLEGGDTDNDSDVDINDVTWFLAQFGDLAEDGDCPWDGTRDADFSNNGAVLSEDYTFLTTNWLTFSTCPCTVSVGGPAGLGTSLQTSVSVGTRCRMICQL